MKLYYRDVRPRSTDHKNINVCIGIKLDSVQITPLSFVFLQFDAQDVLVPWHLQPKNRKNKGDFDLCVLFSFCLFVCLLFFLGGGLITEGQHE